MRNYITLTLMLIMAWAAKSQNYSVKQSDYNLIKVSFTASDITAHDISLHDRQFATLVMEGFSTQRISGKPALPTMVNVIEVPLGDGLKYEILSISRDTLDGATLGLANPIMPAQPSRSKSDTRPSKLAIDETAYSTDAFCGQPTIVVEKIGVARNRNLASIAFNPVSWNPVTNQVIVVNSITVAVRQKNADRAATIRMKRLYASPDFGFGINAINQLEGSKETRTTAPIRYTIIANSMFRGALDEFAAWKRRKGFMVDLVYTDESNVGNTTTSISNYLKGLYNNATESEPAPTYVLLVGDVAQLPAFQLYTSNSHYSDLNYVCWNPGDNIPDCYIGRFSAQNLEQLTPQISKTLMYEQYTFPDDSYLGKAVLIAGIDGGRTSDFGYSHADPTMDYVAKNYVNNANGFTSITYYKNNIYNHPENVTVTGGSNSNGTAAALRNVYNGGCGLVNYTAHGLETMWGDPELSVTHVQQMNNQNKPMVAIGNCCLSNSFQVATCLGEAFLRRGDNAGGVAYIGASEVTYWDEDVYWSMGPRSQISANMSLDYRASSMGMYDQLFHTHGETIDKWHITTGAMVYAGNMAVQNSSTDASMKKYYWEIYHLMGDPSLMPYINGPAQEMAITIPTSVPLGSSTINIQCPPNTYVALTDEDYNLITATFADANGDATLNIGSYNLMSGDYEIAAWAQGYKQHFETITIEPNDTYVKAIALSTNDPVVAGQTVAFDLTIKNIGILPADSIWIEFRSADGNMLIDNTRAITIYPGLDIDEEMTIDNICSATVWNDIADQSEATVKVIARWGNTTKKQTINKFHFDVAAADIATQDFTLTPSADSSKLYQLSITSINNGRAILENATASLLSLDPYIEIAGDNSIFTLNEGQTETRDFTIRVTDTSSTFNRVVPMLYTIANDDIHFTDSLLIIFGETCQTIDFEDATWGKASWTAGSYPWEITNAVNYEGGNCARSKTWNGSGGFKTSETTLNIMVPVDDSVSFYYRVSSEEGYDIFYTYLDDVRVVEASGLVDWTQASFPISAGNHTIRFSYEKDSYVDVGMDAAFIDNLRIPNAGTEYTYVNDTTCMGLDYTFFDTTFNTDNLGEGTHRFTLQNGDRVRFLTLTVMPMPEAHIESSADTIMAGESVRLTATGASRYSWDNGMSHAVIDVYPTTSSTYSVTAYNGSCSSVAWKTITVSGVLVGIDNTQLSSASSPVSVYPNPAYDKLTVAGDNIKEIVIIDIMGRAEKRIVISGQGTSKETAVNINDIANGMHFLQATTTDGRRSIVKFIKK